MTPVSGRFASSTEVANAPRDELPPPVGERVLALYDVRFNSAKRFRDMLPIICEEAKPYFGTPHEVALLHVTWLGRDMGGQLPNEVVGDERRREHTDSLDYGRAERLWLLSGGYDAKKLSIAATFGVLDQPRRWSLDQTTPETLRLSARAAFTEAAAYLKST